MATIERNPDLRDLIKTCVELGTAQTLENLGIHAGEMSLRKARDTYKQWFMQAYKAGRIQPWRVEDGASGTKFFRVVDILALKASDLARAEVIWKNSKNLI